MKIFVSHTGLLAATFFVAALLSYPHVAYTEESTGNGEFTYGPTMSRAEACSRAKNRAKQDAIQKVAGEFIQGSSSLACSEHDDKAQCELNQFSWSTLGGYITSVSNEKIDDVKQPEDYRKCLVSLSADVEVDKGKGPNWEIRAKTNKTNYVDGDNLYIELETTNQNIKVLVFQWQPYKGEKNDVEIIFPQLLGSEKIISDEKISNGMYQIPSKTERYITSFNDSLRGVKSIEDAYLLVLATEQQFVFFGEYTLETFTKKLHSIGRSKYQLVKLQYNILSK